MAFQQVYSLARDVWSHPGNKGHQWRALWRLLRWQLMKRTSSKPRAIPYHGLELLCFPDSTSASSAIYFDGMPDYTEMTFLMHFLRPGDRFIDVGANIGLYTLLAASLVGAGGHIDAFEPSPQAATRLREQVRRNGLGQVAVHQVAAGAEHGERVLSGGDTLGYLIPDSGSQSGDNLVRCVRLEDYLGCETFTMGKMDIEGAEPLALHGAESMLQRHDPPVWQLEVAGYSKRYGLTTDDVIALMTRFDYRCALYEPDRRTLIPTAKPWTSGAKNALFVASDQWGEVLGRVSGAPQDS